MRHLKIAAIGPATRQAIEQHGVKVNVVPKEYVAESVVASLRRKVKGKRVLLARAKVARDVIPRELRKLGAQVDVVEAYETVIPAVFTATAACGSEIPEATARLDYLYQFFHGAGISWRCWQRAAGESPASTSGTEPDRVRLASIGPVTSSTLRALWLAGGHRSP